MGIFLLWTMWVREYMAVFVNIDGYRMWGHFKTAGGVILTKLGQRVNEQLLWTIFRISESFHIIRQNIILHCGLTSNEEFILVIQSKTTKRTQLSAHYSFGADIFIVNSRSGETVNIHFPLQCGIIILLSERKPIFNQRINAVNIVIAMLKLNLPLSFSLKT